MRTTNLSITRLGTGRFPATAIPRSLTSLVPGLALAVLASAAAPTNAAGLAQLAGAAPHPARPGFVFKAVPRGVVGEPVRIDRVNSSVCAFDVEDGPAPADVCFEAGLIEADAGCGFAKEGAGTLRVAGEVRLSGFITVYQGSLDLSGARPAGRLRIHLMGDSRLAPPAAGHPPV